MKNTETEVKVRVAARKIQLPEEILNTYEQFYQHGDFATISEMAYGSPHYVVKVRRAIKAGNADKILWEAITCFYREVLRQNDQILSEYGND